MNCPECKQTITGCPICGQNSLVYAQDAIVHFEIIDGEVSEQYSSEDIDFLDEAMVLCTSCGNNSHEHKALRKIYEDL